MADTSCTELLQENHCLQSMIDRTIPFYNTILRCDCYLQKEASLPYGYEIVSFRDGYDEDWARLEFAIADFDSIEEAKRYFVSTYLTDPEKRNNLLFLLNPEKQVIGSCIAWQDIRQDAEVASLHWLVVDEVYQGMGFGRAMCLAVMNRFAELKMFPVYIHTQPWSWKAILLYISVGFRIQKTDTFSNYENQFDKAMGVLHDIVDRRSFDIMKDSAEEDNAIYNSDRKISIRKMKSY